jgi:hypothetical protein
MQKMLKMQVARGFVAADLAIVLCAIEFRILECNCENDRYKFFLLFSSSGKG